MKEDYQARLHSSVNQTIHEDSKAKTLKEIIDEKNAHQDAHIQVFWKTEKQSFQ